MKFLATKLAGVFEVQPEPIADERGSFMRTWCHDEFAQHGLADNLMQCSISFNIAKGTLRGMHLQVAPFAEAKLVRCTQGALFDVALDLRSNSPTFRQWTGSLLTAANRSMLYIPEGCAHGFMTLEDSTEIFYQISQRYNPESARGFRWNDTAFGIAWPDVPAVMSGRDRDYPDFEESA
jgi:dTDP-4-dehydrorhamnose 3,5-epimerase